MMWFGREFSSEMPSNSRFFWQAKGTVAALEHLRPSAQALEARDVTLAIADDVSSSHRLIVAALAGGKIIGDLRLVATRDDVVIGGIQSVFGSDSLSGHYALVRRRFRLPRYRRGTALLLGAANSDNYYHWLLDSLPRWKMLQAAGWREYDFLLLHGRPRRFQDETLDWLGVPAVRRLRCSKNFVHQFERLVVPAMPFTRQAVPAWAVAWLRSLVPQKRPGPKRVYLSRRGVGGRKLLNEAELLAALEPYGFLAVQAENLSMTEQAGCVGSARFILAPHGAALANMVFAPPGTGIVELFHPRHKNRCYENLAAVCGHRYACLDGIAIERKRNRRLEYTVDVAAVLECLERMQLKPAQKWGG